MGVLRFKANDGIHWAVVFHHGITTREVGKKRLEVPVRYTLAKIELITGEDKEVSTGTTFCSPSDQFCRKVGRKIALRRALHSYPRQTRKAFWNGYWKAVGVNFGNGKEDQE